MKTLVVSNGPIPANGNSVVEGGGIRAWTIQQGLVSNHIECDVIVPQWAISNANEDQLSFSSHRELFFQAQKYDAVILNYAIGDIGLQLFRQLPDSVLRIADLYVPIHVEVMAREVAETYLKQEMLNYERSCKVWEDTLKSSDVFLVTSREQKHYYLGLLSGLHVMNPLNFTKTKMIELPQAIVNVEKFRKSTHGVRRNIINIVWWGGFYPWFDVEKIVKLAAILQEKESKIQFEIVGAVNPFITSKTFLNHAQKSLEMLENQPNIKITPWVNYEDRLKVFQQADAILTLNKLSSENEISWRTRLLDCVEFQTPILTNGGDPFGEKIVSSGGGFCISEKPEEIADFLLTPGFEDALETASIALSQFKSANNAQIASIQLADFLKSTEFKNSNWTKLRASRSIQRVNSNQKVRLAWIRNTSQLAYIYLRRHGLFTFAKHAIKIILRSLSSRMKFFQWNKDLIFKGKKVYTSNDSDTKNLVVILHQLDRSGAVLVALDIYANLMKYFSGNRLILTPTINDDSLLSEVEKIGFRVVLVDGTTNIGEYLVNSDVLINSAAVPTHWMHQCLKHLDQDKKSKGAFFVHENEPGLFLSRHTISKIDHSISNGLKIFVPSTGTSREVDKLFGRNVESRVELLHVHKSPSKPSDYLPKEVNVCVVGPTNDSRKRHLDILLAVHQAQQAILNKDRRRITISFIGVTDDQIGVELARLADQLLNPGSFTILPRMKHSDVLSEIGKCNVVVSLAENESFGIYIAEAMSSGAIVIRTKISGYEETVKESLNGYGIEPKISQLAEKLIQLSNINEFPHQKFLQMMEKSKDIIQPFLDSKYSNVTDFFVDRQLR
jgi:glycosyltransferase involved in cell wall biosynthesis